ncbi:zinc-finger domain-containing protein [Lysinibacillus endophyticus]|uniref:Zinc-finger domain-containing protein n=1 Tax=Ureibacillus endophyticus TaxID=1978490 RepID=A0A494YVY8_9BACL|nr:zinc-finger domain-containing protein [Lysinibacillus endophyticus]MCP1144349.1 zinc-finger domain-containing protein [Lysinibacillus endophyticus]RKQ13871.1 zinc-finger domain-containing protein [Lysinibacillus endophyticus]
MNKSTVIKDIDELTDTYCNDCPIKKDLRNKIGKSNAHRFCIEQCSVGEKLQFLGQELMKIYEK